MKITNKHEIIPNALKNFNTLWKGTVFTHIGNKKQYKITKILPMKLGNGKGEWTVAIVYKPQYKSELKEFVRDWTNFYNNFEFESKEVKEAFQTMSILCYTDIS